MKKILAAGALALAVAGAGTTAYADGGGRDAGARTIRLVEAHPDADPIFVDLGAKGPSIGDVAIAKDGLNREDGTHAGDFDQVCTLVTLNGGPLTSTYECSGTIHLPNGTLTQQGSFTPLDPDQLDAISGGTGAYRAARGEIETQAEADHITIRLR
jgi:hypothetical protein